MILGLIYLCGCTGRPAKVSPKITLSKDHRCLNISGFDKAIVAEIGRDTSSQAWQSLLPVFKMPADTELKDYQDPQPGKYAIADSLVVFTPDTSFEKGKTYFLRYYLYQQGDDTWQYITSKKRLGSLSYKDLIFKY